MSTLLEQAIIDAQALREAAVKSAEQSIIEKYARTQLRMGQKEAKQFANDVLDTVTHQRPYLDLEGATDSLDWVKRASGVQARTLEIEDELIEEISLVDVPS